MASRHTIVAVACLTLGAAEVAYLNIEVAPALVDGEVAPARPLATASLVAAKLVEADTVETTEPAEPAELVEPTAPQPAVAAAAIAPAEPASALPAAASDLRDQRTESAVAPDAAGSVRSVRIGFGRDDATLDAAAHRQLDRIAGKLAGEPRLVATVDGHADRLGEPAHNDELSQHRAEAVAAYLAGRGVDRGRIEVRWFGERQPLVSASSAGAERRNRRVEVHVGAPDITARGGTP